MKKFLSLVALGALSTSMLVGCSKPEEKPAPATTEAPKVVEETASTATASTTTTTATTPATGTESTATTTTVTTGSAATGAAAPATK